jgi:hypothetical protein
MNTIGHSFDLALDLGNTVEIVTSASFFAEQQETAPKEGFDCAGTVGSAGSFGGTLGTFGTFGCCC